MLHGIGFGQAQIVTPVYGPRRSLRSKSLTSKEEAVLDLVVKGLGNKEIARRLGNTEMAIKVILQSIFRKVGVTKRLHLALWAKGVL